MVKNKLAVQTLLSEDSNVTGDITLDGTIKVDGKWNGNIRAGGNVIIGEKAEIRGDIKGNRIIISGHVTGDVLASGQLSLTNTAVLTGDASYAAIVIDEGAKLSGTCTLTTPIEAPAAVQQTETAEEMNETIATEKTEDIE